ncbi:hypothetical protein ZWY2020_025569 [Hordeum vulgare]|nr:hypothetical protein ZWY2020_025569 [Hordeum vulgare]
MISPDAARNIIGNVISFGLFLYPADVLADHQEQGLEEFKSDPYLATLLNCMLWVFYGILCVIFGSAMYASPLAIMGKVIKTKSVEYMPFFLSLVSFLNGVCWTSYALIKFNLYIANGLDALFGLVLYACYYKSTPKKDKNVKLKCD